MHGLTPSPSPSPFAVARFDVDQYGTQYPKAYQRLAQRNAELERKKNELERQINGYNAVECLGSK